MNKQTKSAGKIRVGIIGVGAIALRHIHDFMGSPDAVIAGLVDPDPRRLQAVREQVPELAHVPTYSDYKHLLAAGGVDAVEINTPNMLHYEQIMDSLSAGLHVLAEKPMVCTTAHARAIIAKAAQVNKVMMVAYQRHLRPPYRYIKKMVEDGNLGEITFIAALVCQDWKNGLVCAPWRLNPALSGGGALNCAGSHLVDVMLWSSGLAAETVSAFIDNRSTPVDINSAISIKFTNNAKGTVSVVGESTCGWYEDFTICGTKGTILFRKEAMTSSGRLLYCNEKGEMREPAELPPEGNVGQGFCDVVLGREKNWAPAECGLRVIELTEAAWKSAQTGKAVHVSASMRGES